MKKICRILTYTHAILNTIAQLLPVAKTKKLSNIVSKQIIPSGSDRSFYKVFEMQIRWLQSLIT